MRTSAFLTACWMVIYPLDHLGQDNLSKLTHMITFVNVIRAVLMHYQEIISPLALVNIIPPTISVDGYDDVDLRSVLSNAYTPF